MSAWVYGAGMSLFGKQPGLTAEQLAWEAIEKAIVDAGGDDDIDAAFCGTVYGPSGLTSRALLGVGKSEVPTITFESACASGTVAFAEAVRAVESGRYSRVLVLGVEHMTSRIKGPLPLSRTDPDATAGVVLPAVYAFSAARYIHLGWATEEQLAFVSVKNHDNGALNPNAQYRVRVTVDDVLTSRLIADPLTLLQCAAIGDGAAALVVGRNRKRNRDVPVRGLGLGSGGAWGRGSDVWGFELIRRTAHLAYEDAGLRPSDVSFVELHDAFTIGELVTLGALQLAEPSEVGHLTDSGVTSRGGALPVNPSGGLLSRGHPLGATGVAQVVEVVAQLRGEADARQVDSPAVGLVETMGGGAAGLDGHACVVALLGASASV